VEPTNNLAERDLRPLVMWRKTSFGTESLRGDRFMERVLTVKQTLRRYGPGLYAFVVDSVKAKLVDSTAPRLLPSR
jgi:transposase